MKKFLCCLLIICTSFLGGCFNYNDIDKVIFATACIIDVDNQGNPILYVEAFRPQKTVTSSSNSDQRILFRSSKKTMFETIRDINLSSNYKLNYTQTMGIIFTQKAAEYGIKDFLDIFERDQEFVLRANIAVLKGCPDNFLNMKLKGQEYLGIFIHDLIRNIPSSSREVMTSFNDFLNEMHTRAKTSVIPIVQIKQEQLENRLEIGDGAIMVNYKMVDTLRRENALGYNFILDNIKAGSMEVTNPNVPSKYVSLEILKNSTRTKMHYDGEKLVVKKIINTKASISEAQNKMNLNQDSIKLLESNAENNIAFACEDIFKKYREKNLDIFNIAEDFQRRYPRENPDDIFKKSQLKLEVHVTVEGSSTKTNFGG